MSDPRSVLSSVDTRMGIFADIQLYNHELFFLISRKMCVNYLSNTANKLMNTNVCEM